MPDDDTGIVGDGSEGIDGGGGDGAYDIGVCLHECLWTVLITLHGPNPHCFVGGDRDNAAVRQGETIPDGGRVGRQNVSADGVVDIPHACSMVP